MKYFYRVLLLVLALCAPRGVKAQWITLDPSNLLESITHTLQTVEVLGNQIESIKRAGGTASQVMDTIHKMTELANKVNNTVNALKQLDSGNPWAAVNLASMWGADPQLVGLTGDLANVYSQTRGNLTSGFNIYSISAYDRAFTGASRYVQLQKEEQARMRAAENIKLAEARAKGNQDVLANTAGKTAIEVHVQASNHILAGMADAQADANKLTIEQMAADNAKRQFEEMDKKAVTATKVENIPFD